MDHPGNHQCLPRYAEELFSQPNGASGRLQKDRQGEKKEDYSEVVEAVQSLPSKYRDVVYLYYYEGYGAAEIGDILHKNTNTIYTLLARARKLLKEKLEEVDEIE